MLSLVTKTLNFQCIFHWSEFINGAVCGALTHLVKEADTFISDPSMGRQPWCRTCVWLAPHPLTKERSHVWNPSAAWFLLFSWHLHAVSRPVDFSSSISCIHLLLFLHIFPSVSLSPFNKWFPSACCLLDYAPVHLEVNSEHSRGGGSLLDTGEQDSMVGK